MHDTAKCPFGDVPVIPVLYSDDVSTKAKLFFNNGLDWYDFGSRLPYL